MVTAAAAAAADDISCLELEQEQEEIDEAMDDLLIFPSADVLRNSLLPRLSRYFVHEEAFLRRQCLARDAQLQGQQRILDMTHAALQNIGSSSVTTSCGSV